MPDVAWTWRQDALSRRNVAGERVDHTGPHVQNNNVLLHVTPFFYFMSGFSTTDHVTASHQSQHRAALYKSCKSITRSNQQTLCAEKYSTSSCYHTRNDRTNILFPAFYIGRILFCFKRYQNRRGNARLQRADEGRHHPNSANQLRASLHTIIGNYIQPAFGGRPFFKSFETPAK